MRINTSKTDDLYYKNEYFQHTHMINNMETQKVESVKYLWVYLTPNLSWKLHIELTQSAACKTLRLVRRNLFLGDASTKVKAYTRLNKNKLEYVSVTGSPRSVFN